MVHILPTVPPSLSFFRASLAIFIGLSSFVKYMSDTNFGTDVYSSDFFRVSAVSLTSCATILPMQLDRHFLR